MYDAHDYHNDASELKVDIEVTNSLNNNQDMLTFSLLTKICSISSIIDWAKSCDHLLYQHVINALIPDVIKPIPSNLTQEIRQFAKTLEPSLKECLSDFPEEFVNMKLSCVASFSQTLRRYTSLNHLAHAARTVLQNPKHTNEMLEDISKVNFSSIQEQASWVCQCDDHLVSNLEQQFKLTLRQQHTLDQWAKWLDEVVTEALQQHTDTQKYVKAAKQFLLKWSFYSSMIIRDLTLRSAASFGSFHLIRLLYDEYMFYVIEQKVSLATNRMPIAVTSEFSGLPLNAFIETMSLKAPNLSATFDDNCQISAIAPPHGAKRPAASDMKDNFETPIKHSKNDASNTVD